MAISFIPVRDQARVIAGNRSSAENKGRVLKRLATGKKVADPRDDVADYRKISNMRTSLDSYKNAIKEVSFGISKFETALSVTQSLMELYTTLGKQLEEAKENKNTTNTNEQTYYLNSVNGTIAAINSTLATKFNNETVVSSAATPGNQVLTVKIKDYNDTTVTTAQFNAFSTYAAWTNLAGALADNTKIDAATGNVTTADNNYRLILSGITNLSNIDTLAQVQKTNTEAAISALEDIDVQEEMINLMQAQILEELSSEALIKIKESSKYIVNLIRA